MKANLSGFKEFFERVTVSSIRPDQQAFGHGKDGTMDSLSVQSLELGVPEKSFMSSPYVGANLQLGNKILGGLSSVQVLKVTNQTVTLKINDDGNKRFVKTPGSLYNDPHPSEPKVITVPRAYYIQMINNQLQGASGAMAGPLGSGAGLPMM